MNRFESQLLDLGWVRSPNNIHNLQGSLWYAGAPNIKGAPVLHEVQICEDRIRVFTTKFFGLAYSARSWNDHVTVEVFDSVSQFIEWINDHGIYREAGTDATNLFD